MQYFRKYNEPVRSILVGSIPIRVHEKFKSICSDEKLIMRDVIFEFMTQFIAQKETKAVVRKPIKKSVQE
ncbi:MAG: hypothetical protein GX433_05535 [Deltaproteobacteria bacterium]|nr:hypothetical protein [Deltaproteobacteria bacterium]